ncbi:MAG: hypothetical protein FWE65_02995 [Eggerthellaceae bacterium]|nr:hypothetical protein [Eggerthellaceae bacterium]
MKGSKGRDILLEDYLGVVEQRLKSMPCLERIDVLLTIQSRVEERCFFERLTMKEALESLGDPNELAHFYLGLAIRKTPGLSMNKLRMIFDYHKSAAHASIIVLPCLSVLSVGLIAGGIVTTIIGLIQAGNILLGQGMAQGFNFALIELYPFSELLIALVSGSLLAVCGILAWRAMLRYATTTA